jgi:hypothetical protein
MGGQDIRKRLENIFRFPPGGQSGTHASLVATYARLSINNATREVGVIQESNSMLRNNAGRVVRAAQRTAAFFPSFLRYASVLPDVGDYEEVRRDFHLHVPRHFNFCTVLDKWAAVEKATARNNPAFWWVDDNGNELQWSFGELVDISKRVANLLTDVCKLKRGSKLILVLPRLPEWWIFNVACIRTGIVVSPGTTQLTAYDLQYRLATSEAACIVADESTAVKLDSV